MESHDRWGWKVVDEEHKTVALVYERDNAENIVDLHNKQVSTRARWMGC